MLAKHEPRLFRKKTGYWYIIFRDRTRRPQVKWYATYVQSDQTTPPVKAARLLASLSALWMEGAFDPWHDTLPAEDSFVTLQAAVDAYVEDLKAKRRRPNTLVNRRTTLERLVAGTSPGIYLADVSARHITGAIPLGAKAGTFRTYLATYANFFKWCIKAGYIERAPTEDIAPPSLPPQAHHVFLPSDLERLFLAAEESIYGSAVFAFAATTGLRASELTSRNMSDLDLERNTLKVADNKHVDFVTKTRESKRVIPLWPGALASLARARQGDKPSDPLLLSPYGKRLNPQTLSTVFRRVRRLSKLPFGSLHTLRHTFTTYCLALGVPESKVMRMTGHTNYDTIKKYTHQVDEILQEAPSEALARYLPGYANPRTSETMTAIAYFMATGTIKSAKDDAAVLTTR